MQAFTTTRTAEDSWEATRTMIEEVRSADARWSDYYSAEHIADVFGLDASALGHRGQRIISMAIEGRSVSDLMATWGEEIRQGAAA